MQNYEEISNDCRTQKYKALIAFTMTGLGEMGHTQNHHLGKKSRLNLMTLSVFFYVYNFPRIYNQKQDGFSLKFLKKKQIKFGYRGVTIKTEHYGIQRLYQGVF